jgi:Undecaprenyl-phosphate glucose phosphotransferase
MAKPREYVEDVPREDVYSFETRRKRNNISPEIVVGLTKAFDFCAIFGAGLAAYGIYVTNVLGGTDIFLNYLTAALLGALLFVLGFQIAGGYVFARFSSLDWQLARSVGVWGSVLLLFLLAGFVLKVSDNYSRGWALLWAASAIGFVAAERLALRSMIGIWTRESKLVKTVAIVGGGEPAARLIAKLQAAESSIEIVGLFAPDSAAGREAAGGADELMRLARRRPIDEIVIALPLDQVETIGRLVQKFIVLPVDLRLSAEAMQAAFPVCGISYIGGVPAIKLADRPLKHWNAVAKWLEDKLVGGALLLLLAPVMAAIALLVKWDSPGSVFFVQERFGYDNRAIRVLKFRTMYVDRGDAVGARATVRGDPRVTRVGRVLRAFSLDEFPQLFNVLKGEMSLVGPRAHPLGMRIENRLYDDVVGDYPRRHRVKPGMTGWAQINGLRGEVDSPEKARQRVLYDLYYIDNWSIGLDIKILCLSLKAFFDRRNAY